MVSDKLKEACIVEVAIELRSTEARESLVAALHELLQKDPSLRAFTDTESGLTILAGQREQDLDGAAGRLVQAGLDLNIGAPQVAYRESLGRKAEIDYTHKKQTGGTGQFARVKLVFEPGEPGSGFVFESKIVGGSVPKEYIPGVEKGLESSKENGLLAGFPLIDFKATLIDGAYHDLDSSVLAFEIASRAAFKELREKGAPKLLEPIMDVVVRVPALRIDDVATELSARGQVTGRAIEGGRGVIVAEARLADMLGYGSVLARLTGGLGEFETSFRGYAPVERAQGPDTDPPFRPAVGMRIWRSAATTAVANVVPLRRSGSARGKLMTPPGLT